MGRKSLPRKTFPSQIETPLLTTSQQALYPHSFGTIGSNFQISSPVTALSAYTTLQAEVVNMTPSKTIGEAS